MVGLMKGCLNRWSSEHRLVWLLLVGCCACGQPAKGRPAPIAPQHRFRIISASEAAPFRDAVLVAGKPWVATHSGLLRFDGETAERIVAGDGLPVGGVDGLAVDENQQLWAAVSGGLLRFASGHWQAVAGPSGGARCSALLAADGALWLGRDDGLFVRRSNNWVRVISGARITALAQGGRRGEVWIATAGEGLHHYLEGRLSSHSAAQGQQLRSVDSIAPSLDGSLFAVGKTGGGQTALSVFDGRHWSHYTASGGELMGVGLIGTRIVIATRRQLLTVHRANRSLSGPKELPLGPLRLHGTRSPTAPARYPIVHLYTRRTGVTLGSAPARIKSLGTALVVLTQRTGALYYDGKDAKRLRSDDLTGGRAKLQLACRERRCFVAGRDAYLYQGDFQPLDLAKLFHRPAGASSGDNTTQTGPSRVWSFVTDRQGAVWAIIARPCADGVHAEVFRLDGQRFVLRFARKLVAPTTAIDLRFARIAADGAIWLGLQYQQGGEIQPWGVVVLRENAPVQIHRSSLLADEQRPAGSLALPDDVRDVYFDQDVAWLATESGVLRVRGADVTVFGENHGLGSELVYGVSRLAGQLTAATFAGVGTFDGKSWRFRSTGSRAIFAVAEVSGSRWIASDDGLIVRSKQRQLRLGRVDGLAGNKVLDLRVDDQDRLWVLTAAGLSIIEPAHWN